MGIDLDEFVYPDRISAELICPICHCVVDKPVQTPSEHLFCEDELLEWMVRSDLCPVTHEPLDADAISKPGRIVKNMLAALERYCPNRKDGCTWTGPNERVDTHVRDCVHRSKSSLLQELEAKNATIVLLQSKVANMEKIKNDLEEKNRSLLETLDGMRRKMKVYEAFMKSGTKDASGDNDNEEEELSSSGNKGDDLKHLQRLRRLEKFEHK